MQTTDDIHIQNICLSAELHEDEERCLKARLWFESHHWIFLRTTEDTFIHFCHVIQQFLQEPKSGGGGIVSTCVHRYKHDRKFTAA